MEVDVTGIDHLYLAVSDLPRSEAFYDLAMAVLSFRKRSGPLVGGDRHVHYFNRLFQLTLRPAKAGSVSHDPYSPGLHHLCFRVADARAVDAVAAELRRRGIAAGEPRARPEYAPDYYATCFEDPDGIRLEVVNHCRIRTLIGERWSGIPRIPAEAPSLEGGAPE